MKLISRQSAGRETSDQCTRPGYWLHTQTSRHYRLDHPLAGIADPRATSIADQRDRSALFEQRNDFSRPLGFVELVGTDLPLGQAQPLEEYAGVPRVLRRHEVAVAQRPNRPHRDVFHIPDGRGHKVQRPRSQGSRRQLGQRKFPIHYAASSSETANGGMGHPRESEIARSNSASCICK